MSSALFITLRLVKQAIGRFPSQLFYHAHTAALFTVSDLKTIFFPITAFACAAAPLHSPARLPLACAWIWLHQLMCNISNQANGRAEDAVNKPWRPLPAERITECNAAALRWVVVALCMALSAALGSDMWAPTLGLFLTTFVYDEMNFAGHIVGKNLCNIGGYATFEIGATKLMTSSYTLDPTSIKAVCLSGLLISTTIQAQDFADVAGDAALGRVTFPIYAPELSRFFTLCTMTVWSCFLAWFWGIGPGCSGLFIALGVLVGVRFYVWRSEREDKRSYMWFNVWLTLAHTLPLNTRMGAFAL